MKTFKNPLPFALAAIIAASALGGCRGYNGDKARQERNAWMESLEDSVRLISEQRGRDSIRIVELRAKVAEEISNFTTINNPREVEPYYILTDFKKNYPLTSTGIAARMTKNEQLELIAALSGKQFNAIRVESDGSSVESEVVPYDQALNYTANGLTTVAFSGSAADSICDFVSRNQNNPVNLQYLQNGNIQTSINLSNNQKEWLSRTWSLCSSHKEALILEKRMVADSRKIEILKITLSEGKEKEEK